MENNTQMLPISLLEVNKGQIDGLPKNPRFIRDERFAALVKSIKDAPEMLHLRELLVVKHGKKYVTIGGNMRLRACQELGYEEVPCKVLAEDTPTAKLREYAIKDNNGFGQDDWDILANEWDAGELQDWGMELPTEWGEVSTGNTPTNSELDVDDFGDKIEMKLHFTIDEHAFVKQKLAEVSDENEQAILEVLGYGQ